MRASLVEKWQLSGSIRAFGVTTGNDGSLVLTWSNATVSRIDVIKFTGSTASGDLLFQDQVVGVMNQPAYFMSGRIGVIVDLDDGSRDLRWRLASQGSAVTLTGLGVMFQWIARTS